MLQHVLLRCITTIFSHILLRNLDSRVQATCTVHHIGMGTEDYTVGRIGTGTREKLRDVKSNFYSRLEAKVNNKNLFKWIANREYCIIDPILV